MNSVKIFFCLLVISLGLACNSSTTRIDVLQPAEIFIPENIENIVTIDRSKPASGFGSFLEGVLTGEEIGQDKEGRRQALEGLTEALTRTPRFKVIHSGYEKTGAKASLRLIEPMNWYEVKALCDEFNADAVLAIEMYDSDLTIESSENERKKKNKEGQEYTEIYFKDDLNLSIKMGWRLYDPTSKIIIDEFTTRDDDSGSAQGKTKEDARAKLPDAFKMARDISFVAGQLDYYDTVKGEDKMMMEKAARMAETKDWQGAAKVWTNVLSDSFEEDTKGKAAYNIAIANECLGKLQNARDWAQRAYVDFGNKRAKGYIQTIEKRIYEQQLVEEQMKGRN